MAETFSRGRALGPEGERAARAFLEAAGLRPLGENVRTPFGEIDLLCEDPASGTLVVVEVKARAGRAFGGGGEAVTPAKQRRLAQAALHLQAERGLAARAVRFDVVTIDRDARGRAAIEHIRDAFQVDESFEG